MLKIRLAWAGACMCIAVWLKYFEWPDESILPIVAATTVWLAILRATLPRSAPVLKPRERLRRVVKASEALRAL